MKSGIPGITIEDRKCPRCNGPLFRKPCPCPFKRKGWEVCARCLNPSCATVVGIKKKAGRRGRVGRPQVGPFAINT